MKISFKKKIYFASFFFSVGGVETKTEKSLPAKKEHKNVPQAGGNTMPLEIHVPP